MVAGTRLRGCCRVPPGPNCFLRAILALVIGCAGTANAVTVEPATSATSSGGATSALAKYGLRVATLVPKNSPWGKVFATWAKAVDQKTAGRLTMRFEWNGVAGPPSTWVSRMRTGALQGAMLDLEALAALYKNVYAVELPGVATNWSELDTARTEIASELGATLQSAGLYFAGWGDLGRLHLLTMGYAASTPKDLARRTVSPLFSNVDPVAYAFFTLAGAAVPPPAVRAAFVASTSDTALGIAFAAQHSGFDHIDDRVAWCSGAGAVVFAQKTIDELPPDLGKVFIDSSAVANAALAKAVRVEDDAAYLRLARRMAVVTHSPEEIARWEHFFSDVVEDLAKGLLDKPVVNRVLTARHLPTIP